jgi:hypothetical protein
MQVDIGSNDTVRLRGSWIVPPVELKRYVRGSWLINMSANWVARNMQVRCVSCRRHRLIARAQHSGRDNFPSSRKLSAIS